MTYVFRKPSRPVRRVFLHCSASDNPHHDSVAVIDQWHRENGWSGVGYHFFIRKNGILEQGRDLERTPAAQEGHNVATIAICLHGLAPNGFTAAQFETLRGLCKQIAEAYGGAVSFHGHCEVAAKSCPVFPYKGVLGLDADGHLNPTKIAVGNIEIMDIPDLSGVEVMAMGKAVLKLGSRGSAVKGLQRLLTQLGYHVGAIDGQFGARTQAAVAAFQLDNHLAADGIVGRVTREALELGKPREVAAERQAATLLSLASGGSRIASAAVGNSIAGLALGGGGAIAVIDQLTGAVSAVTGQAGALQALIAEHGLAAALVILAAGAFVTWQSWRAGRARVDDHRSGKTA